MLHVLVSGFVQGIGYRQFVKTKAQDLNLVGWVRNLPDGKVEAVLQGRTEDVEKMILLCRKGPFLAEVKEIKTEEIEDQKFNSFEIVE